MAVYRFELFENAAACGVGVAGFYGCEAKEVEEITVGLPIESSDFRAASFKGIESCLDVRFDLPEVVVTPSGCVVGNGGSNEFCHVFFSRKRNLRAQCLEVEGIADTLAPSVMTAVFEVVEIGLIEVRLCL